MPQSSHLQTHMHSHTIGRRKSVGIEMQKHSVLNPFAIEHCLQKCTLFAKGVLRNNFLITVSRHKDLESIFTWVPRMVTLAEVQESHIHLLMSSFGEMEE